MKIITAILIATCYLIPHSHATTIEGVEADLHFSEAYHIDDFKTSNQYLTVVPERVRFPRGKQKAKFEKALAILEEVLNSDEFKKLVLTYTRGDGQRLYVKNYLWNDSDKLLTNEDVYNIIMAGDERMRPDTLGVMNLNARIRKCSWFKSKVSVWCRKVIGSTNPRSSEVMTLNWKFYRNYEIPNMVSNIVHEWIHLLGFLHGSKNMNQEVPYVVGRIAGLVAKDILARDP